MLPSDATTSGGEALEYTGERMVPEKADSATFWEHIYRYRFATSYAPGRRILDIACGEGYGTRALQDAGAATVIGVDISEETCRHARHKYGVDARQGDADNIPLPNDSRDLIVSFETIEHIVRPEGFLDECARVLVPGGLLVISTPNRVVYSAEVENPFHCSEMDEEELVRLLSARFGTVSLFRQCLTAAPWWSPGSLSMQRSFWFSVPGFWRLPPLFCPHLVSGADEPDRHAPVAAILRKEHLLSPWVNPFAVRRHRSWLHEAPRYLIAVARKAKR